jgi:tRNA pseudouridine32 synthase / 23S rRNA pseudouridine746 synthase
VRWVTGWVGYTSGNVLLSDEAVLVLNKPAGIAVMGERHDTDLVRLAAEAGEQLFPVRRIDKVTSGAILFARELRWHSGLTRQFARRAAGKAYLTITTPGGLPPAGTIDLPLSVGRKNRVRVAAQRASIGTDGRTWSVPAAAVFGDVRHYPAVTTFTTLWQDERHALLAVRPVTGRRHQIRVHLAWIGHPVVGDPLFGASGAARCSTHGGWPSTPPGGTAPGSRWKRHRVRTSGHRCGTACPGLARSRCSPAHPPGRRWTVAS